MVTSFFNDMFFVSQNSLLVIRLKNVWVETLSTYSLNFLLLIAFNQSWIWNLVWRKVYHWLNVPKLDVFHHSHILIMNVIRVTHGNWKINVLKLKCVAFEWTKPKLRSKFSFLFALDGIYFCRTLNCRLKANS